MKETIKKGKKEKRKKKNQYFDVDAYWHQRKKCLVNKS